MILEEMLILSYGFPFLAMFKSPWVRFCLSLEISILVFAILLIFVLSLLFLVTVICLSFYAVIESLFR